MWTYIWCGLKSGQQLYNQMDTFRFTNFDDLYCVSIPKQNDISQNTHSGLVSGSRCPVEKFIQDLGGQIKAEAILVFLEGWYNMPDMVAAHACCCLSSSSPCCCGVAAPRSILPLASTRSAHLASLNPGSCSSMVRAQFFLPVIQGTRVGGDEKQMQVPVCSHRFQLIYLLILFQIPSKLQSG